MNSSMKPSAGKRNFALIISSPKFIRNCFIIGYLVVVLTVIPIAAFDVPKESLTTLFLVLIPFSLVYLVIVPLFIKGISKFIAAGMIIPEPKLENRVDFHILCVLSEQLNNLDIPYVVTPHEKEGWIDVTLKWKDSVDFGVGSVEKDTNIQYEFFKFNKNYTFESLDMLTNQNYRLALGNAGMSYSCQMGHYRNFSSQVSLSKNVGEDGVGIHKYSNNTMDMTNYMIDFFTKYGWKYKSFV